MTRNDARLRTERRAAIWWLRDLQFTDRKACDGDSRQGYCLMAKRAERPPAPEARLSSSNRRRARAAMAARDATAAIEHELTDERICELYRIVEALTEPDSYGSGSSGAGQKGSVADPVGSIVASHGGGRVDRFGAIDDDDWQRIPDRTLVKTLAIFDMVHESSRLMAKAKREWVAILNRKDIHEDTPGQRHVGSCSRCDAPISGAVGDEKHGGLCEDCYGEYLTLAMPTGVIATVNDFVKHGGRCDFCDELCSGAASDRLREAGKTGERYCKRHYDEWWRGGFDAPSGSRDQVS